MGLNSLDDVLHDQVKDLLSAEKQLVAALPKVAEAAHSDELKQAINEHLEETRGHVQRLEESQKARRSSPRTATRSPRMRRSSPPLSGSSTTRSPRTAPHAPLPASSISRRPGNSSARRSTRRAQPTSC